MRVKGGTVHRARRKKALKQAKGYFGSKHRLYKTAKEQVMHSLAYAYRDRKNKKRDFRKLWITRINAACRLNGISYSKFINGLNKAGVEVNRKMLAEIAVDNEKAFAELVLTAKNALDGKVSKSAVKPVADKKETTKEVKSDISKLTVRELKEMAKDKNISGYSTMKKAELIEALK
ncbi:MAG: 50S ribosomal protein L20 [Bacilli bacterium]|nr:50S ribosomal protein L20 [Bacilli bacterium]